MTEHSAQLSSDLRGMGNLTVDAVTGVTDLTEALHQTITSLAGLLGTGEPGRTRGITGMVYQNIRTVTQWVGANIDAQLAPMSALSNEEDSSPHREALLALLNGVVGDHLVAKNNPLAIPMRIRRHGKPLSAEALAETIQQSNGKLAIMVHGSCLNDLHWTRHEHDHGAALARDLGFQPLYIHYNTGLHISKNGRSFAQLLETILEQSPQPVELFIVGHSMGGLVTRSACHYAKESGHTWLKHLRKVVFLGTPHHGALLERGGNWIDLILELFPYSAPFSRLGKIRSCGVTDLRYGNVLDDDWQGSDRFEGSGDQRIPVPLPEGVQCYAVAATTGKASTKLSDDVIGDGLVTVRSALGHHDDVNLRLLFPESHQWIGRNMNHFGLLDNPDVYDTLKEWLTPEDCGQGQSI